MKKNLLISPVYSIDSIITCIVRFNIDKVILFADKPIADKQKESINELKEIIAQKKKELEKRKEHDRKKEEEAINKLVNTFGDKIDIKTVLIDVYDVYETAIETINLIRKYGDEYNILINTTPGRKTVALGIIYGTTSVPQYVKKIVYVTPEDNTIIELPILSNGLSKVKIEILKFLNEGKTVDEIKKATGKTKSIIYSHIRKLKEMGYLNEENELTIAGKIAIYT